MSLRCVVAFVLSIVCLATLGWAEVHAEGAPTEDARTTVGQARDMLRLSAEEAAEVFAAFGKIAGPLRTITELGCGYLSIGQGSNTLSGGEAQRLKLANALTAGIGHEPTVYVLDEPTTGLHLADVGRLVRVLDRLVERGDMLVIVEHHPDVIANADWVVELGPEAGGTIVFEGDPALLKTRKTTTGRALGRIAAAVAAAASPAT